MANPLTLYVPIKQDPVSQAAAQAAYATFVQSVKGGLDAAAIVHYARLALVPNLNGQGTLAILLITTFDGPMDPYLQFFWKDKSTRTAFAGVALLALNPPVPPVTEINGFEKFINANNLNVPADLYQAYTLTVKQITKPKSTTASPA
jgi:hypothetical protein